MYRNESSDTDLGKTFQIKVVSNLPQVIRLATLVLLQTPFLHYENKDVSPKLFPIVQSQGEQKMISPGISLCKFHLIQMV